MSIYVRLAHEDLCTQDKWGWVFYRTTYKDDVAWERFRNWIESSSREDLRAHGASPLLLGALDNIFVSDPALEGASREQLRPRFREWRKPAIRAENPTRPLPEKFDEIPGRYIYFVMVDEESLDSMVPAGGPSWDKGWKTGWVHFVRCDDEVSLGEPPENDYESYEDSHWKVLASRVSSAEFFHDVWGSIHRWDCGPSIDDVMEVETFQLEGALTRAREAALLVSPHDVLDSNSKERSHSRHRSD